MSIQLKDSSSYRDRQRDIEIAYYQRLAMIDILDTMVALNIKGYLDMYRDAEEYLACEGISRAETLRLDIIKEIESIIVNLEEKYGLQQIY